MPNGKKKTEYQTNGQNNIMSVIKELWQAAVNLRLAFFNDLSVLVEEVPELSQVKQLGL